MALRDKDFISKEKHELDYVLRKWEMRTTQANRTLLVEELDRFNSDASQKPHTRDLFYAYAENSGLKARLEAKPTAGSGQVAAPTPESPATATAAEIVPQPPVVQAPASVDAVPEESVATPSSVPVPVPAATMPLTAEPVATVVESPTTKAETESAKKKFPWLWVLLAAVLIVVVLLMLRSCGGCSVPSAKVGTDAVPGTQQPAATAVPAPAEPAPAQTPVPQPEPRRLTAASLPSGSLTLLFLPNSTTKFASTAEEVKLRTLLAALKTFDEGTLVVTGYAASVGYPAGERRVSEGRAAHIVKRLTDSGLPAGIVLSAEGRGAASMVAGPDAKAARAASRRVEISVK